MKSEFMPTIYGFAIPVMVALFVSILARAPRTVESTDLTSIESTSATLTEMLDDSAEGLDLSYLSSDAGHAAERQRPRPRHGDSAKIIIMTLLCRY